MRTAGTNRVVPAVVWLSQAGHSGCAGLSYDGGRGSGAGRGSGGGGGSEVQGSDRDGSGTDWGGEEMV